MQRIRLRHTLLAPFILLALVLTAACGDDDSSNGDNDTTTRTATATETWASATTPGADSTTPADTPSPGATETVAGEVDPPPAYDDASDPLRAMNSYYNAVNRREYQRAYDYWRQAPQSFEDFKQGYANTRYSVATLEPASGIDAAAGNRRMLVAAVIRAELNDGTEQEFAGCYTLWRAASGVSDDPADNRWQIEEALVGELESGQTVRQGLDAACQPWADRVANYDQAYDNRSGSLNVIYSLYDAVNREDFRRAYGYWENPPQSFDDFAQGYADTVTTAVTVGTPAHREGAAGSVYEEVPVVLHATTTGGDEQRFSGCYVLRRSNVPAGASASPEGNPWAIYSATISSADAGADVAVLLRSGCDSTP